MNKILYVILAIVAISFAGCDVTDQIYDSAYEIKITNDGNGTAKASAGSTDITEAGADSEVTLTATPNTGYRFTQWTVVKGNVTLMPDATTSPATFKMPLENVEIRAEFELIPALSVSPDTDQNVAADATSFQFAVTSNTPWECRVDGSKQDEGTGDKTVTVTFPANTDPANPVDIEVKFTTVGLPTEIVYDVKITQAAAPTYAITLSNDGNGTAAATVGGAPAATAVAGETVIITATPTNSDYEFKQWSAVSGGVTLSSTTANPATFTMPAGAVEIRAEFQPTVTYVNTFLIGATIAYNAGASDAAKTVYNFTLPSAPAGAEVSSTTVTSAATTITSSVSNKTMTITSSDMESAAGPDIKVEFTVAYEGVTSTATGTLTVPFTGAAKNAVGGVYYKEGLAQGVVFVANMGSVGSGKVVSLTEGNKSWGAEILVNTDNSTDGLVNMATIKSINDNFSNYPAFAWVDAMNGTPGSTIYSAGITGIWYLPAIDELYKLYSVWNSDKAGFNNYLTNAGGTALTADYHWSSTESTYNTFLLAQFVHFSNGNSAGDWKGNGFFVCCILAF